MGIPDKGFSHGARKPFNEALGDLLARYSDDPAEDVISELEIRIMALKEDQANAKAEMESDD